MLGSGRTNKATALDQREYQLLFDTVPQGVVFHDADGRVIAMNPAAERILGRPPEELNDHPSAAAEHGTIREDGSPFPGMEHPSMVAMRTGREVSDVVMGVYNPRERRHYWISITAVPLFRPGEDRPYRVYTLFQDITRQKGAEQALRECEMSSRMVEAVKAERKRLYDVLDTLQVMICLITPGYGIAFANRAFREKFSESRDRLCNEYCYGQRGPCDLCQAFKVFETGRPHCWEVHQPGGSVIEVHDYPFRDADGSPMVLEMGVDVTDQKRAEEALRDSEARFRSLIEQAPVAIGMSRDGLTTYANPRFLEMFGYPDTEQLYGRPFTKQIAPEDRDRSLEFALHFASGRSDVWEGEFMGLRMDGSQFPFHASIANVRLNDGPAVLGFFSDITERKRMEEDLRRSNAELEQFAYVASHDLQEPLRMVTNYLQLIERREMEKLDETSKRYMGHAVEGAMRMKAMIDDILTYSRVESKRGSLNPVDIEGVLSTVLKNLNLAISESGAAVTRDALPTVEADRGQMFLLLKNLVGNAIKYRSEAAPQVHVSACRGDGEWIFSVQDNGIGIDPKYADKLFKMFSRLHTKEEYPGTGMGLAIAKKIVERHGGRIWFESEPGMGTTFYFSVPLTRRM